MRAVSVRGPTVTENAGPTGWSSTRSRTTEYSGMNTVTVIPDAAWYFARLATASPSPPVRAKGESSAARCTTGAGEPSGRTSGAVGAAEVGAIGVFTSVRRVRLRRRGVSGRDGAGAGALADNDGEIGAAPLVTLSSGVGAIG